MHRLFTAVLCLFALPAYAQLSPFFIGAAQPIGRCDFRTGVTAAANALIAGPNCPVILFNRSGPKNEFGADGMLHSFNADVPAVPIFDPSTGNALGFSLEGSSTILNRWSRALTNWSLSPGMTATLNQTGIDGSANSATLLSASAPSQTASISGGGTSANQRVLSAYVKRVIGTGEIDISLDCQNFTPITGSIAVGSYSRVPFGGLYNSVSSPSICFRIVHSGDAIAVDYVNQEADTNLAYVGPTSPVLTTGSANVIRQPDNAWIDLTKVVGWNQDHWTITGKYRLNQWIVPSGDNSNLRRGILQVDNGSGWSGLFLNNQTDGLSNPHCSNTSGNPPHCPDTNMDGRVAFVPLSVGKVRASNVSGNTTLSGLAPPGANQFASFAISYDVNLGTCISVNTGGPPTTLANGQYFQSGVTQPVCTQAPISPAFAANTIKRLVLGSAPDEATVVGGTPGAGDTPQLTATWEDPQGTTKTETVTYTVQAGNNATDVAAGLAAAINADATMAASGIAATNSGVNVLPAHGPSLFVTWSKANSGGTTIAANNNTGNCYCDIQTLNIYPVAYQGNDLMNLVPSTSPAASPLTELQAQNGAILQAQNGSLLQAQK